jgi:hypothetical protein
VYSQIQKQTYIYLGRSIANREFFCKRVTVNRAYGLVNYIFPVKCAGTPSAGWMLPASTSSPCSGLLHSTSRSGGAKSFHISCVGSRGAGGRHALYVSPTPLSAPVNLHHQGNWEDHLNLVPSVFPASVPSFWLANTRRASFGCLVQHPHLCLHHIQIWITCVRPIGRIRNANCCLRLH